MHWRHTFPTLSGLRPGHSGDRPIITQLANEELLVVLARRGGEKGLTLAIQQPGVTTAQRDDMV